MKQFLATATFAALLAFASTASAFGDTPGLNGGDMVSNSTNTTSAARDGKITPVEQRQLVSDADSSQIDLRSIACEMFGDAFAALDVGACEN